VTNNPSFSEGPTICESGPNVYVMWQDMRDVNFEVYCKRSTDGGLNWGADTRLTNNSFLSGYASACASGLNVHIAWIDTRDGNQEIYYKRSTDGGINWEADTRLTNNSANSYFTSMTISGTKIHVVWYDGRDSNF